jgi:hypothetical protein
LHYRPVESLPLAGEQIGHNQPGTLLDGDSVE